jgi:hypothetical protein
MQKFATGIAGVRGFLYDLIDSQHKKESRNSPFYVVAPGITPFQTAKTDTRIMLDEGLIPNQRTRMFPFERAQERLRIPQVEHQNGEMVLHT